jgi:hypothetical protein
MMMATNPVRLRRVDTMVEQLDRTADEYSAAREEFDAARVRYEVARDKFASVRRLAINVLSTQDWWNWRNSHESVQYTGLKLGEAISDALENHAYDAAVQYWTARAHAARGNNKPEYSPVMPLERIQETLERGGFEFRTTTPLREVNAALINAPTVKKEKHGFKAARADEVLQEMSFIEDIERDALAKKAAKAKAVEAPAFVGEEEAKDGDVPPF